MCVLVGNHHFVISAVLDVSFAVNSCLNRSFYIYCLKDRFLQASETTVLQEGFAMCASLYRLRKV